MGKDSLLKSTSKKKPVSKKTGSDKKKKTNKSTFIAKTKTSGKSSEIKGSVKVGKTAKKTVSSKKTSAIKTTTRRQSQKPKASQKKKVTGKKLVLKQFETWKPEKPFRVEPEDRRSQYPAPPPFVSEKNKKETERIRALLFKKFDNISISDKFEESVTIEPDKKTLTKIQQVPKPDPANLQREKFDPASRMIAYLAGGLIVLVALIISASVSNRSSYYLKAADGALEVWQGTFAPLGKEKIIVLPGSQAPGKTKTAYSKNEIFSFVFNHYLEKADTLINVPGMPDFEGIKLYLNLAQAYAVDNKHKAAATSRINSIDLMTYLYKADVASSKGTASDFNDALNYLNMAAKLELDVNQADLVKIKIQTVKDLLAALKAKQSQPDKKPHKPSEITNKAQNGN